MQIGVITVSGRIVGSVTLTHDTMTPADEITPILASYESVDGAPGNDGRPQRTPGALHEPHHHAGPDHGDVKGAYPEVNLHDPATIGGSKVYGRLAGARDRAREELKEKPWLNDKAMHIFAGENQDPAAATALWESAINRAAVRGTSLEKEIRRVGEGGYYAGYNGSISPKTRKVMEEGRDRALNYSNVSNYATDNSSNQPGNNLAERDVTSGRFQERNVLNREHFFSPLGESRVWHENWKGLVNDSEAKRAVDTATASTAASKAPDPETEAP